MLCFIVCRPHVLGVMEKSCVEDTTVMTVKLMQKYPLRMDMVLRIFDTHNTYYSGMMHCIYNMWMHACMYIHNMLLVKLQGVGLIIRTSWACRSYGQMP